MGGWCRRGQLNLLALCCLCLVGGQKEAPREELQAPMLSSSTVLIPRGMATVLQVVVKFSHVTDEKKVEPPTRPPQDKSSCNTLWDFGYTLFLGLGGLGQTRAKISQGGHSQWGQP